MAKPQPRPYISSGNVLQRYHSSFSSCYLSLTPIASESSIHSASPQLHRRGIRIPRSLRHDTILRALIVKKPLVEMAINHCLWSMTAQCLRRSWEFSFQSPQPPTIYTWESDKAPAKGQWWRWWWWGRRMGSRDWRLWKRREKARKCGRY